LPLSFCAYFLLFTLGTGNGTNDKKSEIGEKKVRKDWIETDGLDEEARWEDVELLLTQVTPDIGERDMLDAFLLAIAASVQTNSLEKTLDLSFIGKGTGDCMRERVL
jgi:hypothetical protein